MGVASSYPLVAASARTPPDRRSPRIAPCQHLPPSAFARGHRPRSGALGRWTRWGIWKSEAVPAWSTPTRWHRSCCR